MIIYHGIVIGKEKMEMKKALSLILAVVMCLSLMPLGATCGYPGGRGC